MLRGVGCPVGYTRRGEVLYPLLRLAGRLTHRVAGAGERGALTGDSCHISIRSVDYQILFAWSSWVAGL
jgi:hypothetical protein